MDPQNFVWKVAGAAGEGIMTTGLLFSKVCARHGLKIFDYTEYPSLIRGGHNTYQVHAGHNMVNTHENKTNLLIALNKEGVEFHMDELNENSMVLFDRENDKIEIEKYNLRAKSIDLPMVKLAKEAGGKEVMANNVTLGASIYLLGLDLSVLDQLIADIFGDKGEEIINMNQLSAKAGYDYVRGKSSPLFSVGRKDQNFLTMTGNEAIALGAIAGGLQFYCAYPMTPSSSILTYLAEKAKDANIIVKHAEDEISVVNMALGASFTGVRAMVGTSGGGFCYMTEALGLSGVAELPLVVILAMRPGPALGLPTWTEQGDLSFALSASNGEFPRFVLAPGDAQEAFELSKKAQELAEKYQIPIVLISDKYMSESRQTLSLDKEVFENKRMGIDIQPKADENGFYPRYKLSETGISDRTLPGTVDGIYVADSYSHNDYGLSTEESNHRKAEVENRFKKLGLMKQEIPPQFWEIEQGAQITLISFGSTKGSLVRAKFELTNKKIPINILNLSWIWPFPLEQVKKAIESAKNVVVVEGNIQGQLANLITQETGKVIKNRLNRYDGRPFEWQDIVSYIDTPAKPPPNIKIFCILIS